MTTFADTFTDTNAVLLQNHTGEGGLTWTKHSSASQDCQIATNRIRVSANTGTALYYCSWVPLGPEYDIDFSISELTDNNTNNIGVCARVDVGANTFYTARYTANSNNWELFKFVAGTPTSLGAWGQTIGVGPHLGKLEIRNATKKLFVAGVERISSGDNVITATGRAGIRGSGTTTDSTGIHLVEMSGADAAGGAPEDTGSGWGIRM